MCDDSSKVFQGFRSDSDNVELYLTLYYQEKKSVIKKISIIFLSLNIPYIYVICILRKC